MTNLTEKWKNGELEERQYFVRMAITDIVNKADYFCGEFYTIDEDYAFDDYEISEVLAPVPSYEEWRKLNGGYDWLTLRNKALNEENDKLKELLKACRDYLYDDSPFSMASMIEEIDEVLNDK